MKRISLLETAYHEAGHAVVAWLLGLKFQNVTVKPNIDGTLGCLSKLNAPKWFRPEVEMTARTRVMAERRIVVFFAGRSAQEQFLGKQIRSGFESDYDAGVALAAYFCSDSDVADAYLNYCRTVSRAIVRRYWAEVATIATALAGNETLTFSQVAKLIRLAPKVANAESETPRAKRKRNKTGR